MFSLSKSSKISCTSSSSVLLTSALSFLSFKNSFIPVGMSNLSYFVHFDKSSESKSSNEFFFLTVYFQNRIIMIYVQNNGFFLNSIYDGNRHIFEDTDNISKRKTTLQPLNDQYSRFKKCSYTVFSKINCQRGISL
jgi:hypothetical protein